jgi:hypothetical protein
LVVSTSSTRTTTRVPTGGGLDLVVPADLALGHEAAEAADVDEEAEVLDPGDDAVLGVPRLDL